MKIKPTVLQVVTGLGVGGAERVVIELSNNLPDLGYRTIVVALNGDGRLLEQYDSNNTAFHFLDMTLSIRSVFRAARSLRQLIHREEVGIIHAHMFHALVIALIARGFNPKPKVIFTSHSSKGFSILRRFLIRACKGTRAADIVFQKDQHPKLNAALTKIIPNGVAVGTAKKVPSESRTEKHCIFLFLGRLETAKNPVMLVRLFAQMQNKTSELWLAGDGYLREKIEDEIRILGLNKRVRLLGVCPDVSLILGQVDCLVMASLWEGLPMAILEAGAAGLPVVSTKVGAIPELLAEDCGYLVDLEQIPETLDSIAISDVEARRRGALLLQKVSRHYSLEMMAKAHAALYDEVSTVSRKNEA